MADEIIDRGDDLDDKLPPSTIDDTPSDDEKAAEKLAEDAAARGDEEATDTEEKDEQPRGKDGKFAKKEPPDHVPKARFDEAVGKERAAREAAERRAAELAAQLKQEEKSADVQKLEEKLEGLEKQHAKLLLDGEHEKAAAVMKEIRHGERQIAKMESSEESTRATERAVEQVRMEATIAKLEADYPVFNPDSEVFDQDLVDLVLAEQSRLIQVERLVPSKALAKAGEKIMKRLAPAAAADKEGAKGLAAAKGAADRKAEQVAKNLDTAKRQPASMKDSGKDSDKSGEQKIDVSKLTASEFNALPESTKRRLRGDDI